MTDFKLSSRTRPVQHHSGRIIPLITFLLAVLSLLGVVYVWLMSGMPMGVPDKNTINKLTSGELTAGGQQSNLSELTADLAQAQKVLGALQAGQKRQQTELTKVKEVTSSGKEATSLKMAEVDYLLRLAHHRVSLINDVDGGIALLESADKLLFNQNQPAFLKVRKAVAMDLAALKALPKVDVDGIYSQLSALALQVSELPQFSTPQMKKEAAAKADSTATVAGSTADEKMVEQLTTSNYESPESFADKVKSSTVKSTKTLWERMRIKYHSDFSAQPMLNAEQHFIFTQHVRLLIEQAKVSLLTGQQTVYENSLQEADELLAKHAQKVSQATVMRETLSGLKAMNIEQSTGVDLKSLSALLGLSSVSMPKAKPIQEEDGNAARPVADTSKKTDTVSTTGTESTVKKAANETVQDKATPAAAKGVKL
ncbi:MAG: uroporphyrinogen-III C-methyltransferase [Pseudomonadota bacterium]